MNEKKETKGELLKVTGFEGVNLANAIVNLCHAQIPKMESDVPIDRDYINLVKKSRKYINLVLDKAMVELEDIKNE